MKPFLQQQQECLGVLKDKHFWPKRRIPPHKPFIAAQYFDYNKI